MSSSSSEEELSLKRLQIPLQDIVLATKGFANENFIERGGFGEVYKGMSEKHGIMAIKRLNRRLGQGDHEFRTEIAFLSVYKHENIVSLLGFCDEQGEKILVYKYESKGSLDKHLDRIDLTWIQRLQICLDAALGLKYLHEDVDPEHQIVHRDIKSANILLDENYKAKVSDFGLSRKGPRNATFVISNALGTIGYIDPDYVMGRQLTQKSDVFSFGVVLFEVLCGRLAYAEKVDDRGQIFNILVQKHYKNQTLDKIIHCDLQEQINPASLLTFSRVAYQCLKNGVERPTMKKVVEQLQKALKNQLAASGPPSNIHDASLDDYEDLQRQSRRTSSSSHSTPGASHLGKYDVFLSFSGEYTRNSFVDRLEVALHKQGITTFKVDTKFSQETFIHQSHIEAIEGSKIAIVVFSRSYADSPLCLDELVCIMECNARGLFMIPVFYDVDPSDVRKQRFTYSDAFVRHELNNRNKVESWRKALTEAASIAGLDARNSRESEIINLLIYTLSHKLLSFKPNPEAGPQTSVDTYKVGMGTRLQKFKSSLQVLSGNVQMVAICGIWGSGKSTLASSVYDDIRHDFEGCCFIRDVHAESIMHGLKMLQEKILSTLLRINVTLRSIEEGINMMKNRLHYNRFLIVLDNVTHIVHLKMLAGSRDWFGEGSLIIITTRNKNLAEAHKVDITHDVKMLDANEATDLFNQHASITSRPKQGCEGISLSLVSKLRGHPSALISLGSFLRDKSLYEWMITLDRLEDIPSDEILEKFYIGDDGVTRNIHSWLDS